MGAFYGSELVNLSAPFLEDSVVSRLQEFLGLYSLETTITKRLQMRRWRNWFDRCRRMLSGTARFVA